MIPTLSKQAYLLSINKERLISIEMTEVADYDEECGDENETQYCTPDIPMAVNEFQEKDIQAVLGKTSSAINSEVCAQYQKYTTIY